MFDYKTYFNKFCIENKLDLSMSFDLPVGYETAGGMFDIAKKTVFINKKMLSDFPEIEQCFCFFHELRHALQYLKPELFDEHILNSLSYVIMYDGTCYKVVDGEYFECKIDGDSDYFLRLYKGQPYEVDANMFAFDKTKELFGLSEELKELCTFYLPDVALGEAEYEKIYRLIDKKNQLNAMSMNVKIVNISDDAEKTLISRKILESLTDWFEIDDARERYIADSCGKDFFCAFDEQNPIGFLYMKQTGNATVEMAIVGVLPQYQRMGVGRQLFNTAKAAMKSKDFSFIQVKTVQFGKYDIYDKTNKFYIDLGFKEFETLPTLWDEANPCQIYVMSI